ncbi:unnamed protein product [Hymenolepis diminuta]|uniref:Uncharacterized protein n=1 Tax=Hymenolepis diminuta TaxID=6216 RepID=A0A564ZDY1_HYMDI|nr:unnamed protein product [Hymenolepis diminuta]
MPDLLHAIRITIPHRKLSRNDYDLYFAYLYLMDPAYLTYESAVISDLVLSKKTNSDSIFSLLVSNLFSLLGFDSDICSF